MRCPAPLRLRFFGPFLLLAVLRSARAQEDVFTFNTHYQATNLGQFSSGAGTVVDYRNFLGFTWNESTTAGGFSTGLFGELYGAQLTAFSKGQIGLDLSFKVDSGSVALDLPNKVSVTIPNRGAPSPVLNISQDRSGLGSGNLFQTTFPQIAIDLAAVFKLDAGVKGTVAYGFGSSGGEISLSSLASLGGLTHSSPILSSVNPFDTRLNLLSYNTTGDGKLYVLILPPKDLLGTEGLTIPISTKDILAFNSLPLKTTLGVATLNPPILNLSSGAGTSAGATQDVVVALGVDIPGIITTLLGLPLNPLEPRVGIPGTPLEVFANLLSVDTNLGLGLRQQSELLPNTKLGLQSNLPVTYQWTDGTGLHQVTTTDLLFPLDNAAMAQTLTIVNKPIDTSWQLFPRIEIAPELQSTLYLQLGGFFDIIAGQVGIGAFGVGATSPALLDVHVPISPLGEIELMSRLVQLTSPELQKVYRFLTPLFGTPSAGVEVAPGTLVEFTNRSGLFLGGSVAGTLSMQNALLLTQARVFDPAHPEVDLSNFDVSGTLRLLGANSEAHFLKLSVADTGSVNIDGGSKVFVTGAKDQDGNFILDGNGKKSVGFVDADGLIATGNFTLGGVLSYDGPDIARIGTQAAITLNTSIFDSGPRFDNNGVDGLRKLGLLEGSLTLAGPNLDLQQALTNSGTLTLTNGSLIATPGGFTNTAGGKVALGRGSSFTALGAFGNVNAGVLSDIDLTLGGSTTGAVLNYGSGGVVTSLAETTKLTLSGARPTNGYLQQAGADALTGLAANAGEFVLTNGATQSTTASFNNQNLLELHGGSQFTIGGSFTDSGTTTIHSGQITVAGDLGNITPVAGLNTLDNVNWTLGGPLTYTGSAVALIGSNVTMVFSGAGSGLVRTQGNAFAGLTEIAGDLSLLNGASLSSNLDVRVSGILTVGSGALASFRGMTNLDGELRILGGTVDTSGGAANAAYWAANPGLSSLPVDGNNHLHPAGALVMNGTLVYAGPLLAGIAPNTTLTINSPDSTPVRNAAAADNNGLAALADLRGTLNVRSQARTDAALTVAEGATLNIEAGGTFRAAGPTLTFAPGANVTLAGTLGLGGAGLTTSLTLRDGFIWDDNGIVELGAPVLTSAASGTYYENPSTGRLFAEPGTHWTNLNHQIVGAGEIAGGQFTNRGAITAGGGTLLITDLEDPLLNTGVLTSVGVTGHSAILKFDNITILNRETVGEATTNGQLIAASTIALNNSTVTGGQVIITSGGTLETNGATLTLDAFNFDGHLLVKGLTPTTINAATVVNPRGSVTLEANTSLVFGAGGSFLNRGQLDLAGGASITGVTIQNEGSMQLAGGQSISLANVNNTNAGTIHLANGSTLVFSSSSVANAGLIHLSGENPETLANSQSTFLLTSDLTLTGGGMIQLGGYKQPISTLTLDLQPITIVQDVWTNAGFGRVRGQGGTEQLVLESQTLLGRGNLGEGLLSIRNGAGGRIATGDGVQLTVETNSDGFRNQGRLEVGNGGTLDIAGGPFLSYNDGRFTEGTYRLAGTLKIPGLVDFSNNAATFVFEGPSAALRNGNNDLIRLSNNEATGSIEVRSTSYTFETILGGATPRSFTNAGTLAAGPGGTLIISGGNFTNFANQTLTGGTYRVTGELRFDGADIVTNAANLTLIGSNPKIRDEANLDGLRHFATNAAGASLAFSGMSLTLPTNATTLTNQGRIALTDSSSVTLPTTVTSLVQKGDIYIGIGSTLDLKNAVPSNPTAAPASYWIGGTLRSPSPLPLQNTQLTFYGPGAQFVTPFVVPNTLNIGVGGHVTMAGGYSFTPVTGLINNAGLLEIGSPAAIGPNGQTLASAGSATFPGVSLELPIFLDGPGTTRFYGGATDDGTTGSFNINHLKISGGTFDASGIVNVAAGGSLTIDHGLLAATTGPLEIRLHPNALPGNPDPKPDGGTFYLTGGIDIHEGSTLAITGGHLVFTPVDGSLLHVSGSILRAEGLNLGAVSTHDIALRNAELINSSTNQSALATITENRGSILLEHSFQDFPDAFSNFGPLSASGTGIRFRQGFTNTSQVTFTGPGSFRIDAGGLINQPSLAGVGATFSGVVDVTGDVQNFLSTMAISGSVTGNLGNSGTLTFLPGGLTLGGDFVNSGTTTMRNGELIRSGGAVVPIVNAGALNITGSFFHDISGPGDVHTTGTAELRGTNTYTGQTFVTSGQLIVGSDAALGAVPVSTVLPSVLVSSGASFQVAGTLANTRLVQAAANATVAGGPGGGAIPGGVLALGALTIAGELSTHLTPGGTVTLDDANLTLTGSAVFNSSLTGDGSLTIASPSVVTLNAASSLTGAATIAHELGILEIGSGGSTGSLAADIINQGLLTFNRSGTLEFTNNISGAGEILLLGGLDLTLTKNITLTGRTRISAGTTLRLGNGGTTGGLVGPIENLGTLAVNRSGTITLPANLTGGGAIIQAGTGTLVITNTDVTNSLTIAAGRVHVGAGDTLTGDGFIDFPTANSGVFAFDHLGSVSASAAISGTGAVNLLNAGTLTLTPGKTYSGATQIGRVFVPGTGFSSGGGVLAISADSSLGAAPATFTAGHLQIDNATLRTTGTFSLAATRGVDVLFFGATFNGTDGGTFTIPTVLGGTGGITKTGAGTLALTLDATNTRSYTVNSGTLSLNNAGADVLFTGPLAGTDLGSVTFTGAGTTTFRTDATFAGQITIAPGTTLRLGGNALTGSMTGSTEILGTLHDTRADDHALAKLRGEGQLILESTTSGVTTTISDTTFDGQIILRRGTLSLTNLLQLGAGPLEGESAVSGRFTFDGGRLSVSDNAFSSPREGVLVTSSGGEINVAAGKVLAFAGAFDGSGTLIKTGAGILSLSGGGTIDAAFDLQGGGLRSSSTSDQTFTGLISGPGSFAVEHSAGLGQVTLTANNTYTGGTTVLGGVELRLGNGGESGGVLGAIDVFLGSAVRYARSDDLNLPNTVSGEGGLVQAGPGTLTIQSPQSYTGTTAVTGGTLRFAGTGGVLGPIVNDANLLFDYSADRSITNAITGAGAVTKAGSTTLTLTANGFSGATNVNAGTLELQAANPGSGGGSIGSAATLRLTENGALGGSVVVDGTLALARTGDYSLGLGLAGGGQLTKIENGTATFTTAPNFNGSIGIGAGQLAFSFAGTGSIGGATGTGTLVKQGSGTLVATGSINSGALQVLDGTMQIGNGGSTGQVLSPTSVDFGAILAFNRGTDVGFAGMTGGGTLRQKGAGTLILTGSSTHTGGTIIDPGTTLQVGAGGFAGSLAGVVTNNGTLAFARADALTFTGSSSGTGVLHQTGPGAVTLTGANTATGGATIDSGATLVLAPTATLTGPVDNAGTLQIQTSGERSMPVSLSGAGTLTIAGGGTLHVEGNLTHTGPTQIIESSRLKLENTDTSILTNVISGNGGLAKLGTGTLILAADNTYTGTTELLQGTLQLGNGGTTGSIGGGLFPGSLVLGGGTLAVNRSDAITLANTISGSGGLNQLGSGVLTLTANNTYLGTTTVGAGAKLRLGLATDTGSVIGPIVVFGTLEDARNGNTQYSGGLNGNGTFQKITSGTLTLGGAVAFAGHISTNGALQLAGNAGSQINTYQAASLDNTGSLIITGNNIGVNTPITNTGTLQFGAGGSSGSTGSTINNLGTLIVNHDNDFSFTRPVTGGGAFIQAGTGTTRVSDGIAASSFTVQAGILEFTTPNNVGVSVAGGAYVSYLSGTFANAITGAGGVRINGAVSLTGPMSYTGETLLAAGGTFTLDQPGTFSGSITGPGNLTKLGVGVLELPGGGSYTGTTTISQGTLRVGGNFASNVNLQGALEFNNAAAASATGNISGFGTLTKTGAGNLTLSGSNTYSGNTTISAGRFLAGSNTGLSANSTISLANASGVILDLNGFDSTIKGLSGGGASGGAVLLNGATLTVRNSDFTSTSFSGVVSGNGGLIKTGSSGLALLGTNTYTGPTTVTGGTLSVVTAEGLGATPAIFDPAHLVLSGRVSFGSSSTLGANHGITVNDFGGELATAQDTTLTVNAPITGDGFLYIGGSGRVQLNAVNTIAQGIGIQQGATLVLGRSDAVNPESLSMIGGTLDVNGFNWSAPMEFGRGTLASSAPGTTTLSSDIMVGDYLGLGTGTGTGTLLFNGHVASVFEDEHPFVWVTGSGTVRFASESPVFSFEVDNARLVLETAGSVSALDDVYVQSGQIDFAGRSPTQPVSQVTLYSSDWMNGVLVPALINSSTTSPVILDTYLGLYSGGGPELAMLGGAGDLTFNGILEGYLSISKVGTGTLTINSTYENWFGGIIVNDGTLAAVSAFFQDRPLTVNGGHIQFTDLFETPVITSLTGSGSVAVSTLGLTINQSDDSEFSGNLAGTGPLLKQGSGTLTLTGTLSVPRVDVTAGELIIATTSPVTAPLKTTGEAIVRIDAAAISPDGGATLTGNLEIGGSGFIEIRNASGPLTANAGTLTFSSPNGTLYQAQSGGDPSSWFNSIASNTGTIRMTGGAEVNIGTAFTNTGTLVVDTSSAFTTQSNPLTQAAGAITVDAGGELGGQQLTLTGGHVTLNGTFTQTGIGSPGLVIDGGLLTGSGHINGGLILSGGQLSPGNSPGTMTVTGTATFASGGQFLFEFNAVTGTAGVNWDLLSISSTLDITSSLNAPFTVALSSLTGDNNPGLLAGFNPSQNYLFRFATAGAVTGFDAGDFVVDTSLFANAFTGDWEVELSGSDLYVSYNASAIPEPSTSALIAAVLGLGLAVWRRRNCDRVATGS